MNGTIELLMKRKSVRVFLDDPIPEDAREAIIKAALRAPTAGNMMMYSIIEVLDQEKKNKLVKTCDNQPFIAKAPLVLLFLADYQRWYDYYKVSGVPKLCEERGIEMRKPAEGDLMLACCDALIAAQTAVIAAESLGIGSCYIGDIMENCEIHRKMFELPDYVFPITMVCFGYPTKQQMEREQPSRFEDKFIVYKDKYKRLSPEEFEEMYKPMQQSAFKTGKYYEGAGNIGQHYFLRKFASDFSVEMSRSVKEWMKAWVQNLE